MKKMIFAFLLPLLISGCGNAQSGDIEKNEALSQAKTDTIKPEVDIKVNKVYDDNGNLIRYDSVYVWSYSNVQGDSVFVNPDSIMKEFKPFFEDRLPDFAFPGMNDFFFTDSLFYHDFFMPDYFFDRWKQSMQESERMLREMDSLKNLFFKRNYPGLQFQNSNKDQQTK